MKLLISDIQIDPRIRIDYNGVPALAESISRLGQIAPIIVEHKEGMTTLVDGGSRIEAAKQLQWTEIEAVYITDLDPLKRIEVEFEANEKRSGWTWQERCLAYRKLHLLKGFSDPKWSLAKLQDVIGKSIGHIHESLSVADALERTKGQKDEWEKGLWKCESFYTACQYLAMRNEDAAFAEIERRKTLIAERLGQQQPKPFHNVKSSEEGSNPKEERKPFKVEIFNRPAKHNECEGCLIFGNDNRPEVDKLLSLSGATIIWSHRLVDWQDLYNHYSKLDIPPLLFPLIWATVKGKALANCPFYLNYKLGLFIPMPNYRTIEPMPAVITAPLQDDGKIPLSVVQHSLEAISREGDKIWLPYGGPVVEVAQCNRIPVWQIEDEAKTQETKKALEEHYTDLHGKCEFIYQ